MGRNSSSGRGGGRSRSGRHSHQSTGRSPRHGGGQRPASQAQASPLAGKELELAVDSLALGGAGVARMPEGVAEGMAGMAVFVQGALPGSRVQARLTAVHRRHAEAVTVEVLQLSPEAVEPFCGHFGVCGGCSLQHLSPQAQLEWKERQIVEALARIGGVRPERVLPAIAAPALTAFRNKMEFAFQSRGGGLILGLYEGGNPGRVFDLSACPIFPAKGSELVGAVREACRQAALPAYDRGTRTGLLRHLVLRHSVHQGAWLAQIITAPATPEQARAISALGQELMRRHTELKGFAHAERARADGLAQGERTLLTLGESALIEALGDVRYAVSAEAFFQTCTRGAEALYSGLRELLAPNSGEVLHDLYCGGGGIALFLAGSAGQGQVKVLGLEMNPAAIADAEANARLNKVANCRFLRADLSGEAPMPEALPQGFARADAAIVDPPREGLDAGLARWLAENPVPRLGYVSCNPATLARDAGILKAAYRLEAVRAVDLFPHTAHAECLALFVRA